MILDNGSVRTDTCVVLWDGITRPEAVEATADKPASQKFTLKLAFAPDSATYAELHQASNAATALKYPTGVPRGFETAFRNADVPELPGYLAVNAATFATPPEVYDMQGRLLSPADYSRMFYAGTKVQAVLTPRVYDAKGNRGAGFWLGGVLIVDASAPKLSIASGLSSADVRNAFGLPATPLGGAAAPAPVGGAPVPPVQPAGVAAPAPASFPQPPAPAGIASSAPTYPSSAPAPVAVVPNPGILAAPPAPAPVPAAPAAPVRTMTPAAVAAGYTYEALAAAGWSDQQMIQGGYLAPM